MSLALLFHHLMLNMFRMLAVSHHASHIQDRRTVPPYSTLSIYLVNKYIEFFF